jgi:hypothetical protein
MSFMDKVKSFFSGGSSAGADEHAGHDHSAHAQAPVEPSAPMPPADPAGMPTSDAGNDAGEDRPA